MHPHLGIAKTDAQYINDWAVESAAFEQQAAYAWMAERLAGAGRVLEIGSGSGQGTLALVEAGNRVIAVEANAPARQLTLQTVMTTGRSAIVVSSMADAVNRAEDVVIVDGNFLADAAGYPAPLDVQAIACWNIGAAPGLIASSQGKAVDALPAGAFAAYRATVHEAAYRLARRALPSGSRVHVVDRTAFIPGFETHMAAQITQIQQALAGSSVTILPHRIMFFPYTIPASGMTYILQTPLPRGASPAFVSSVGIF